MRVLRRPSPPANHKTISGIIHGIEPGDKREPRRVAEVGVGVSPVSIRLSCRHRILGVIIARSGIMPQVCSS